MRKIIFATLTSSLFVPLAHAMSDIDYFDFFVGNLPRANRLALLLPSLGNIGNHNGVLNLDSQERVQAQTSNQITSSPNTELTLQNLPVDILYNVFSSLAPADLLNFIVLNENPSKNISARNTRCAAARYVKSLSISLSDISNTNFIGVIKKFSQVTRLKVVRDALVSDLTNDHLRLISTSFPCLTHLTIADTRVTANTLTVLEEDPELFTNLISLDISQNSHGDELIKALAKVSLANKLVTLNISRSFVTPAGIAALVQPNTFTNLQELNLSNNGLGDTVVHQLASSPFASRLRVLSIAYVGITKKMNTRQTPGNNLWNSFISLISLDLSNNQINTLTGIVPFIHSIPARNLQYLNLRNTDNGMAMIAMLHGNNELSSIKILDVADNTNTLKGFSDIVEIYHLCHSYPNLEEINIGGLGFSSKDLKELRESYPAKKIIAED